MAIIARGADAFEEASIDEAYVDLSSLGDMDGAVGHVRGLKAEILAQEGLTCSAGIGPNKLVAKIASDFRKPDGLTVVRPEEVETFLDRLRIRVIPGIGPKTEAFLHGKGVKAVAELRRVERAQLTAWFGKRGLDLGEKARGISDDAVSNNWERKSVGEQETFEADTLEAAFVFERAGLLPATCIDDSSTRGSRRSGPSRSRFALRGLSRRVAPTRPRYRFGARTSCRARFGDCSSRSSTRGRTRRDGRSASSAFGSRSSCARACRGRLSTRSP
jgi:nucleotidyltransferase/DNA polymerase involved in DNA repair